MRAPKIALRTLFAFILGGSLCFLFLFILRQPSLSGLRGYVPVEEVLSKAGYVLTYRGEDVLTYERQKGDTTIQLNIDLAGSTVDKSGLTFSAKGQFFEERDVLYGRTSYLEEVLNLSITQEKWGKLTATTPSPSLDALHEQEAPFIIHATGGLYYKEEDGSIVTKTYPNAFETFQNAYERGFRVFECDFGLTSDGELVAVHSWKKQYGFVLSYEEFMASSLWGLNPLDLEGVLELLSIAEDAYLILDMKLGSLPREEVEAIYQQLCDICERRGGDQVLDRIIPQIYYPEDYEIISAFHDWTAIIYTLYKDKEKPAEEILAFLKDKPDILSVAVPRKMVTEEFS
ncbi:MAG: hypothetical protein IIZ39_01015, partial [Blautia sp.]|nr:hypothetical protein [Blautia sp.]